MTNIRLVEIYSIEREGSFFCPFCGNEVIKHKNLEKTKNHIIFWTPIGTKCTEYNCEVNHKC